MIVCFQLIVLGAVALAAAFSGILTLSDRAVVPAEAGVDVSVPRGSEKIVEFKAPAPGAYQWYCIPHASSNGSMRTGMVGTL